MEEFSKSLAKLMKDTEEVELKDVDLFAEYLEFQMLPTIIAGAAKSMGLPAPGKLGKAEWTPTKFKLDVKYPGTIETIEFIRSNGKKCIIGGENVPPFYNFLGLEKRNPHPPLVTYDVFDMGDKMMLPKPIKKEYKEVLGDPAEWAKFAVDKFGAECITFHSLGIDPGTLDWPVSKSREIFEDVLQAVDVPVIIGCSGNKEKDVEMFKVLAEVSEDEVLMLSAADKATWEEVIPLAVKHDHNCLLWTSLDMNNQIKMNKDAIELGLPRNRIVMDPTCATLGYGMEYSFSIYQRMRIAGLLGEENLAYPISGGTTNAWGAREAWMSEKKTPSDWGAREYRGPIWEIINALSLALVGLDLAMMFHPVSASHMKDITSQFFAEIPETLEDMGYYDWVSGQMKR
ncbi:MAG: CO dehydrogenase/acetyl-CoA synthase subunit delta [Candidatus Lokiarchaeota archaeon]|nr:CO dehydrogenase/acetyl-CoA synthase subunit delta [Candidatus Lokiarchaeota archaeon]MBD3198742.1 CO dehydrogenase/acetyl-CoA synthase subunit delta [Candidatus Lokiarchaeota archaeon]